MITSSPANLLVEAHAKLADTVDGLLSGRTNKTDLYYEFGRASGIRSALFHADLIDQYQFVRMGNECTQLLITGTDAICARIRAGGQTV